MRSADSPAVGAPSRPAAEPSTPGAAFDSPVHAASQGSPCAIFVTPSTARGRGSGSKGSAAQAGRPAAGPAVASLSPAQFPGLHVKHQERKEAVVYFATRNRPGKRPPQLCFPGCGTGEERRVAAYAVVLGAPWNRPVPLYDAKAVWDAGLSMGGDASNAAWGRWSADWCQVQSIKQYLGSTCLAPITKLPERMKYADGRPAPTITNYLAVSFVGAQLLLLRLKVTHLLDNVFVEPGHVGWMQPGGGELREGSSQPEDVVPDHGDCASVGSKRSATTQTSGRRAVGGRHQPGSAQGQRHITAKIRGRL